MIKKTKTKIIKKKKTKQKALKVSTFSASLHSEFHNPEKEKCSQKRRRAIILGT